MIGGFFQNSWIEIGLLPWKKIERAAIISSIVLNA
jgi:hypothetical protein